MTDRLLVFSNPEIQELLAEKFIPVAADDWYQRRRQDAEGEFFRAVADQGPRRTPGGTKQGHYILSAPGTLLGYNNNRGAERRLAFIHEALKKWNTLPADQKTAAIPEAPKTDPQYNPEMPKGTQVVKVYTRALVEKDGILQAAVADQTTFLTAVDHLWLTPADIDNLHTFSKGGVFPPNLSLKIARYHLRDNTRGEPRAWAAEEVKTFTLSKSTNGSLEGIFKIESTDSKLGFEGKLSGQISFSSSGLLEKFDLLVTGKHWGEGRYTKGARPGKKPLGQVYQFISQPSEADLILPQGLKGERSYLKMTP